jgi:hypothetical protein
MLLSLRAMVDQIALAAKGDYIAPWLMLQLLTPFAPNPSKASYDGFWVPADQPIFESTHQKV